MESLLDFQSSQNISDVSVHTDGFSFNLIRCIGFTIIQTGIRRVRPIIRHLPETVLYYAWRIVANS